MTPRRLTSEIALARSTPKMLLSDLRRLIAEARQDIARQVNSGIVLLDWRVGRRICRDILREEGAEYGEQIVSECGENLGGPLSAFFAAKKSQ